ncbi:NUDIX hydrolase [Solirubrobacter sp. CPCC 204708]|uniref:NUDIX hydrolase n=1 Tax=Solirubrobacter deserti TaxID=2282478 RepID=A0ABT4RFU0_9ACTN|nr:NUDIX hydrolase [Solirubrobacter deserti]MBE2318109.1 NUDIX hydrolase [Solirubrobacter deserti]MDA0137387.1 NUDIX hydrolase [Solirubrobacter deserti]
MAQDGPEPGTILNETGVPTTPRQAATVLVVRGGAQRLEVLLAQRTPKARFMGGAWVFPGGAVDASEDHRAAALREVREEVGITLPDPAALVPFARWITPEEVSIRFDTWFFVAVAPDGAEVEIDGSEIVDARWFQPDRALAGAEAGELLMVFPTIKTLEQVARFGSADALIEWASTHEVRPVKPRVEGQGEAARIVLDDER